MFKQKKDEAPRTYAHRNSNFLGGAESTEVRTWGTKADKKISGFTLIELLVFAAVLAITSVTVIVSYRETARKNNLYNEAMRFVSFLRQAQNNTINGIECNDPSPNTPPGEPACPTNEPPEIGYGLATNSIIYPFNNMNIYANRGTDVINPSEDPLIETYTLQNNIIISSSYPGLVKGLSFKRPYGDPIIDNNGSFWPCPGYFRINYTGDTEYLYVAINGRTGRIYITDQQPLTTTCT